MADLQRSGARALDLFLALYEVRFERVYDVQLDVIRVRVGQ